MMRVIAEFVALTTVFVMLWAWAVIGFAISGV